MTTDNTFDARNADIYEADATVNYTPNTKYHVRMLVNFTTNPKTYSVWVTPEGGIETQIANNFSFRTEASDASNIGQVTLISEIGSYKVERHTVTVIEPADPGPTTIPTDYWLSQPLSGFNGDATHNLGSGNNGVSETEFDVTPLQSGLNATICYADYFTTVTSYKNNFALIRMTTTNTFDARNGGTYMADAAVSYTKNVKYHVRMRADFTTRTYSVWVTPDGGTETQIANNYAFRTEAAGAKNIGQVSLICEIGSFKVSNHIVTVITPGPTEDPNVPPVTYNVGPTREFTTLQQVVPLLKAGDTILLDGDCTYTGGVTFVTKGTADKPVTLKGIRVNGKRPIIQGGGYSVIEIQGDHTVLEGLDITGDPVNHSFRLVLITRVTM